MILSTKSNDISLLFLLSNKQSAQYSFMERAETQPFVEGNFTAASKAALQDSAFSASGTTQGASGSSMETGLGMMRAETQPFYGSSDGHSAFVPPPPLEPRVNLLNQYKMMLVGCGATIETQENLKIQPEDTLIIIDLQNDFLPGGSFAVEEGDEVVEPICDLISVFLKAKAHIYCSRDYHPIHHCSFEDHGGIFPTHCVQGTWGSRFVDAMSLMIQGRCHPLEGPVFLTYKGFSPDVDSFGAVHYDNEILRRSPRIAKRIEGQHCASTWTGSFLLFSSNAVDDCNAPPDVMAVLDKRTLPDHLKFGVDKRNGKPGRLFVAGLTLDYCVLDSAVNAANLPNAKELFTSVNILIDTTRAAHVEGFGKFGTGFLTDPAEFVKEVKGRVNLVSHLGTRSPQIAAQQAHFDMMLMELLPPASAPTR